MYVWISVHVCACICVCALYVCLCHVRASVCMHVYACMPVFMGWWKQRSYQSLKRNSNQFSSNCHHFWAPRHLLEVSLTVDPWKNPYWQQTALCQGWQSCVCLPLLKIKMDTPCKEIKFHLSQSLSTQIWTNQQSIFVKFLSLFEPKR